MLSFPCSSLELFSGSYCPRRHSSSEIDRFDAVLVHSGAVLLPSAFRGNKADLIIIITIIIIV